MKPENKYSTATLITGILSLIPLVSFIIGPISIILGIISLRQIKNHNQGGKNKTLIGLIVGIFGFLLYIGIYGWMYKMLQDYTKSDEVKKAYRDFDISALEIIEGQLELEFKKNGTYPESLDEIKNKASINRLKDLQGNRFHYEYLDSTYVLRGLGQDSILGTEDDIIIK